MAMSTSKPNEGKVESAMTFLHAIVLLVLVGDIQCSPVKGNFSFLVNQDLEVRTAYTAFDRTAVFNCTTNDATAKVTLNRTDGQLRQEKITRNGAVFTIHGITRHDAGHYLCVAKRKNGQAITRKILLYIDSRNPSVKIVPHRNSRVLIGSRLSYTCEGKVGKLTWLKDGMDLPTDKLPGVSVLSSHGPNGILEKDLDILQADLVHSGRYTCLLTFRGKKFFQYVEVSVKAPEPASITSETPHHQFLNDTDSGPNIKLGCLVSGFPIPKITWTKDGKEIKKCYKNHPCDTQTRQYILTSQNSLIIRKHLKLDEQGVYRCEAENSFGRVFKEFILDHPSPKINVPAAVGIVEWHSGQQKSIVFSCNVARGTPRLQFKWYIRYRQFFLQSGWLSINNPFFHGCFSQTDKARSSSLETPGKQVSSCFSICEYYKPCEIGCSVENDYGKDEKVLFEVRKKKENGK